MSRKLFYGCGAEAVTAFSEMRLQPHFCSMKTSIVYYKAKASFPTLAV